VERLFPGRWIDLAMTVTDNGKSPAASTIFTAHVINFINWYRRYKHANYGIHLAYPNIQNAQET
jgi:hypothetical protein